MLQPGTDGSAETTAANQREDGWAFSPPLRLGISPTQRPPGIAARDTAAGRYEQPDWYFEGWLLPSGFDHDARVVHIRMYIESALHEPEFGDTMLWQVIPNHPLPDESIRLVSD